MDNYPFPRTIDRNKSTISNSKRNLKYFNENKNLSLTNRMKNIKPIETNGDYIHIDDKVSNNNNKSFEDENNGNEKNEDDKEKSQIKKQNYNWFKYMWYLISCCTNNKMIAHYEKIRENLISKENIIQNYFDIYNLSWGS